MNNWIIKTLLLSFFLMANVSYADFPVSKRTPQYSNEKVTVWESLIYPGSNQILKMHRHDFPRILVAFDSGTLKIASDKGEIRYLKLEKNKSYYLPKDTLGEMHTDENMENYPIKILVIEIK